MSHEKKETHTEAPTQQAAPQNPWDDPAFIAEVAAGGFPDSPHTDAAWRAALYNFRNAPQQQTPKPAEHPAKH